MVGTGILSNNMRSPSPECYTTFWMMSIYSDTLHWSGITPIFDHISDLDLITEFASGFHRTFATGAACQQRTLTPPDIWSFPTLGLASVLMLRPISPELVLCPDFWVSNIPRYLFLLLKKFHFWVDYAIPETEYLLGTGHSSELEGEKSLTKVCRLFLFSLSQAT